MQVRNVLFAMATASAVAGFVFNVSYPKVTENMISASTSETTTVGFTITSATVTSFSGCATSPAPPGAGVVTQESFDCTAMVNGDSSSLEKVTVSHPKYSNTSRTEPAQTLPLISVLENSHPPPTRSGSIYIESTKTMDFTTTSTIIVSRKGSYKLPTTPCISTTYVTIPAITHISIAASPFLDVPPVLDQDYDSKTTSVIIVDATYTVVPELAKVTTNVIASKTAATNTQKTQTPKKTSGAAQQSRGFPLLLVLGLVAVVLPIV